MNYLTTNLHGSFTRIESHQGRDYLVSPVVMLREGVHSGSQGALFYDAKDLESSAASWNGMPVVVNHPSLNGHSVSVNDLPQSDRKQVGTIKNARWERGKLKGDAWLDVDRMGIFLPEFLGPLLNDGSVMEVSTGLFTENENFSGHFEGKDFQYVARNHRPDHLALLPGQVGACSIADGCGLNVNQSHERNLPNPTKEHATMNIHVTGHALFARTGLPVLNHGTGDRDDNLVPTTNRGDVIHRGRGLPLPVINWDEEKPTNNCGCNGHGNTRETEADIDKQFDRATAIAENMSMVSNGTRDVLPAPRMFGPPPSGGIRLGGGEPTVNGGYSLFGGAGNAPVMNRGGDDDSPLPLPVMTWD